jgi:serine phosphatase RsbU (regulator of sigma subunit)
LCAWNELAIGSPRWQGRTVKPRSAQHGSPILFGAELVGWPRDNTSNSRRRLPYQQEGTLAIRAREAKPRISREVIGLVALSAVTITSSAGAVPAGADVSTDVVVVTGETLEQGIELRDGWRFHAGDDPAWADPAFDDSGWHRVDSGSAEFGPEWRGIGWLRRRLPVDASFEDSVVGLQVRQAGASELYLDGRRVATLGKVSADATLEVAWDPRFPVAIALEPGQEHLLAVRFSLAHRHELLDGLRGLVIRLGPLEEMMGKATHSLRGLVPFMAAAAGMAGALALVHGLLFLFDRRAAEHAFFAAFAGFLALDVFADMMMNLTADLDARLVWFRVGVPFLVAMLLSGVQLELVLFERRRGWVFWGLAPLGCAMVVWAWSIPAFRSMFMLVVFMALAVAEMLRLAVLELLQRRPDSAVVAAGLAIFALSFLDFFGGYIGVPGVPTGITIVIGWGAAVVSLSVYIARRAARTNLELRERLDEVAELTRRTVEQERRAARELVERRVLEADNLRKTHEIEQARALQLAMLPDDLPSLTDVEIAFRMRTATEVGGDFYDWVADGSERCTIVVGDATGHGMHAGMVVAVAKSLFTTLASSVEPERLLDEVSRRLAGLGRRGATMALAVFRIDGTRLEVAGAAMPPLLVWRLASGAIEEVSLAALPLGRRLSGGFPSRALELAAGDSVLVSTDGLSEVLDRDGEPWGYQRVAEAFARAAQGGPESILDDLLLAAEAHAGGRELPDDITLAAIQARESV